jgi:hypothetical protein
MFCLFMIIVQTMVSQYILQTTILLKALYHIWYYTPTNFIQKTVYEYTPTLLYADHCLSDKMHRNKQL